VLSPIPFSASLNSPLMVCQDLYPNKELGKEFYDHAMQVHEALVDYIL